MYDWFSIALLLLYGCCIIDLVWMYGWCRIALLLCCDWVV